MKPHKIAYQKVEFYKWRLRESLWISTGVLGYNVQTDYISLDETGLMILKGRHPEYAWNGASGPAIDTKNFMRATAAHDAGYQLLRLGFLPPRCRVKFDKLLHRICREDGMSRIRAAFIYRAVRICGGSAAKPRKPNPILYA